MAEPNSINWANGDADYSIEPSSGKKLLGWVKGEKPPYQFMNFIHKTTAEHIAYTKNKIARNAPLFLRSSGTATWDGQDLVISQDLELSFRDKGTEQINVLPADTYTFTNDGDVLVVYLNRTDPSPFTMTQGDYVADGLVEGEFDIVADAALTADNEENETLLFRRNGTNLEIVVNGNIVQTGMTFTFGIYDANQADNPRLVPIGSIVGHYDFNATASIDTDYWAYCDGSTISNSDSPLNGLVLPDASNRYLVGFGTEAGGDIDTAAWSASVVGNASHQINIQHSHTGPSHTHTFTTASNGGHSHTLTAAYAKVAAVGGGSGDILMDVITVSSWTSNRRCDSSDQVAGATITEAAGLDGSTDAEASHTHTGTTDASGASTTSSSLSATQSIQPRSIRVRWIMRIV